MCEIGKTLLDLHPGEAGIVKLLLSEGSMRRRLQDLGLVQNTFVTCVGRSPLGDPSAYLIRGAVIAIRAEDSKKIILEQEMEEKFL